MKYYSLNEYCKNTFGHKLYKLSVDGGMTCPNRDGKIATDGCIFCSEEGSGEFAEKCQGSIRMQLENAKKRVEHKNKGGKYIAYFQSFTNTYAPVSYLEKIFFEAINHEDVEVLSIATRPDCLPNDVLELLSRLNSIKPVWVELGLQTSNEKTAEYIGRGYENIVFAESVKRLNDIGIKTVAHLIIGLPGETYSDYEASLKFALDCGVWGIKLHLLHVLKGTRLLDDFEKGKFECLTLSEYSDVIAKLVSIIPKDIVIHRLTGDGDKNRLVAPLWSGDKKTVLNLINKKIDKY